MSYEAQGCFVFSKNLRQTVLIRIMYFILKDLIIILYASYSLNSAGTHGTHCDGYSTLRLQHRQDTSSHISLGEINNHNFTYSFVR